MAVAALVLGIIALLSSWILMYFTWYLSIPGLVFAIIVLVNAKNIEDEAERTSKLKMSKIGLILNILAIIVSIVMIFVWGFLAITV